MVYNSIMENTKLTYSEIVYLFAEKFVSERAKFVNQESHPSGEKYPAKTLGYFMIAAAFEYLKKYGYISIEIKDVKKMILFNGKDVIVNKLKDASAEITGIEHNLLANIKNNTKLEYAVYNLLSADENLPSGHMIAISKDSLAQKGFLTTTEEKKFLGKVKVFSINQEKYSSALSMLPEVETALVNFRNDAQYYSTLMDFVKKGVVMREERSDSFDD